jgi:hypothetical protein
MLAGAATGTTAAADEAESGMCGSTGFAASLATPDIAPGAGGDGMPWLSVMDVACPLGAAI